MSKPAITWELAYSDDLTEIAFITKCETPLTPKKYLDSLEAALVVMKEDLHKAWRFRPTLESDPELN